MSASATLGAKMKHNVYENGTHRLRVRIATLFQIPVITEHHSAWHSSHLKLVSKAVSLQNRQDT